MKDKADKIRTRISYVEFLQWYNFLRTNPSIGEIMVRVYRHLDRKSAFGSQTASGYAYESIGQVIRDKDICATCKNRIKCLTNRDFCY